MCGAQASRPAAGAQPLELMGHSKLDLLEATVGWHFMKRTTIKLPEEIDARLRHEAAQRGVPIAEIIREAIEIHLESGGRRHLIAAKTGRSGRRDTARRIEEIIRQVARR